MRKKIIIDTSWWIPYILSKFSGRIPDFFVDEKFDLCFSVELLQEITALSYTRSKKRINDVDLESFINFIEEAVVIDSTASVTIWRDKKDNFLLALERCQG